MQKNQPTQSIPLTFGELNVGDHFIAFPSDGDDSGHGGYRSGAYLFTKSGDENAKRVLDNNVSHIPLSMKVYKVIL